MNVSVVVPTYRRPELLARCLEALLRQRLSVPAFEIIVADDAAWDETHRQVEAVAADGWPIRYVAVTGAHGPAAARNAGWKTAVAPIIAFTDDDCLPDSGWLQAGLAPFANPAVDAVTGQTIVPLPPRPTDHERNTAGLATSEFVTANCLCRRRILEELGGFDERFTAAWREDSDLHFRLLDRGAMIVRQSSAVVVHPARPAPFASSLGEQRKAVFEALLYRKHPRLFRERIRPRCPWDYYLIVAGAFVALLAGFLGWWTAAFGGALLWAALTFRFFLRRVRRASLTPTHLAEMAMTSIVIPFLSVYWRLRGAVHYRVAFC